MGLKGLLFCLSALHVRSQFGARHVPHPDDHKVIYEEPEEGPTPGLGNMVHDGGAGAIVVPAHAPNSLAKEPLPRGFAKGDPPHDYINREWNPKMAEEQDERVARQERERLEQEIKDQELALDREEKYKQSLEQQERALGWNTGERLVKPGPESLLSQSAFEDVGEVEVNDGYSVVSGRLMSPSEDEDCDDMVDTKEPMRTPIKELPPVLKRDLPLSAENVAVQTDFLPVIKVEGEGETDDTATTVNELMSAHASLEVPTTMSGVVSSTAPLELAGYNNRSWHLDVNAPDPSPGSELKTTHVVKLQPGPDLVSQARDKARAMLKNIFPANKGDLMPNDALMPEMAGVMGHNMAWAQMNEKGEYVIDENPSESPVPSPSPSQTPSPSITPSPGAFIREVMLPDRPVAKEEIADVAFEKELYLPNNALMSDQYSPAGEKLTMVRQPEGDELINTFQETIPSVASPKGRMSGNLLVQDAATELVGLGMGVQEQEATVKQDVVYLHKLMNHSPEIQRYRQETGHHPAAK